MGGGRGKLNSPFLDTISSSFNSLISGNITNVVYIPPTINIAGSSNQRLLTGDVSRKYNVVVHNVCIIPIEI